MPITLTAPGVRLDLLEHGARVHRLWVPDRERIHRNVALGHPDEAAYRRHSTTFHGATIGRYTNRLAGAAFTLGGREHALSDNDRGANLHGGASGWHARVWDVLECSEVHCSFGLHSPDGDEGFPGAVDATVTYRVAESDAGARVEIAHRARTDAPTLVAMTNHTYFNLDGEGAGTIDLHELRVAADHYTPTDDFSIPHGRVSAVDGTPFDFREPRVLGVAMRSPHPQLVPARGIDHNFVLIRSGPGALRPVARLRSPASGLAVTLATDQPGLQVYTGNFLDGSTPGTSGVLYRQGDGIALEPQIFPDAPHHEAFGSAVLMPDQEYVARTVWAFAAE